MSLQYYTECIQAGTNVELLGRVKKFYDAHGDELQTPYGATACVVELPAGGFVSVETEGLDFVMVH